jgi:hypothetical protein
MSVAKTSFMADFSSPKRHHFGSAPFLLETAQITDRMLTVAEVAGRLSVTERFIPD